MEEGEAGMEGYGGERGGGWRGVEENEEGGGGVWRRARWVEVGLTEDDHVERAGLLLVKGGDLALVEARVLHRRPLQAHPQRVTRVHQTLAQF